VLEARPRAEEKGEGTGEGTSTIGKGGRQRIGGIEGERKEERGKGTYLLKFISRVQDDWR
jgi:hypothetical protein